MTNNETMSSTESDGRTTRKNLKIDPETHKLLAADKGVQSWSGYLQQLKDKADAYDQMQAGEGPTDAPEPEGRTVETTLAEKDRVRIDDLRRLLDDSREITPADWERLQEQTDE